MKRTAKNILRHELIGLCCRVVSAQNSSQAGLHGKITDETMKTICIETEKGEKTIQKKGSALLIRLPLPGGKWKDIEVDGDLLVCRPEDRIKKKAGRW